jgi:hypothetical protein
MMDVLTVPVEKQSANLARAFKLTKLEARNSKSGGASIEIVGMGKASRNTPNSYSSDVAPRKFVTLSKKRKIVPSFSSEERATVCALDPCSFRLLCAA